MYQIQFLDVIQNEFAKRNVTCLDVIYYVRHDTETHENRRFFSTGIEFAQNTYAYVLKLPSRS